MNILNIINKKKHKEKLSQAEIEFFVEAFVQEKIENYQVSSLLMAILLNDMDDEETSQLTSAMINSGDVIDLSEIDGIKSDKHSTGGVGDKTSIALIPMVSSLGVKMTKMSGKGLGHTGGTLDKLESIPGFKIELSEEEFINQVRDFGSAIISQTDNLVPADKKLYALRDVTGTVDSIPLIASSIMSKKLASGADTILLDVKCGKGAFMQDLESAEDLARAMVAIGKNHGKDTQAIITDMNEPLGYAIGNSLELIEAIETLKGNGPEDFLKLCLEAGAIILKQGKVEENKEKAKSLLLENINNGKALESLKDMIRGQGGNENVVENYSLLTLAKYKTQVNAPIDGYINSIDALKLGLLSADLGAGRKAVGDKINHGSGFILQAKTGDKVSKGQELIRIYHDEELDEDFIENIYSAYEFSDLPTKKKTLIYNHIV